MKKVLLLSAMSLLLGACSSAPVIKSEPVQGVLKNETNVSLRMQDAPAVTAVRFNATGYTIFGVAYVAAAVAKMNSQSNEMSAAYNDYFTKHPEIGTLQDTFNNQLENDLSGSGITINKISAEKSVSEQKEISYKINPSETNGKQTVIIDGLTAMYFAPSSTDEYNPRAGVLISVMDPNGTSTKPLKQEEIETTISSNYAYKDYDVLNKDIPKAYAGLQESAKQLAHKVAESLLGRVSPDSKAKIAQN